jgi:hypothetical protein
VQVYKIDFLNGDFVSAVSPQEIHYEQPTPLSHNDSIGIGLVGVGHLGVGNISSLRVIPACHTTKIVGVKNVQLGEGFIVVCISIDDVYKYAARTSTQAWLGI